MGVRCALCVWLNFVSKVNKSDKRIIFINTLLFVSHWLRLLLQNHPSEVYLVHSVSELCHCLSQQAQKRNVNSLPIQSGGKWIWVLGNNCNRVKLVPAPESSQDKIGTKQLAMRATGLPILSEHCCWLLMWRLLMLSAPLVRHNHAQAHAQQLRNEMKKKKEKKTRRHK